MNNNSTESNSPFRKEYPSRKDHLAGFAHSRVLVTGGAGFVGSNLVRRLVELGAEVVVLDDFSTGRRELLPTGLCKLVEGSVTDLDTVQECIQGCSFVFHLAVQNIILSTTHILSDYSTNIGGTLNVLLAATKLSVPPRIVYTSSASVYGNPRSLPISEESGISILSPYAASKFAGESYCSAFYEVYQLVVSIVRYSNVYGINQSPLNPYCGVVSKFFAACLEERPIEIHGSGTQTRDFTYVEDAVEATLLAAIVPRAEGQIFNVGTGWETDVAQLARLISDVVGVPYNVQYIDRRDIDNIQRRVMNIERARRILRWVPRASLTQGLQQTYDWLKK